MAEKPFEVKEFHAAWKQGGDIYTLLIGGPMGYDAHLYKNGEELRNVCQLKVTVMGREVNDVTLEMLTNT